MKKYIQQIALFLLGIFTISFVPFNWLHHHPEDEHFLAMHRHDIADSHHCELDDYFCSAGVQTDCGHKSHLHKTIAKCFACEFHFIKHFEASIFTTVYIQGEWILNLNRFRSDALHEALIRLSNKGPPAVV